MIYLNNTATSYPKPISVINSLYEYLNNPPSNFGRSSSSSSSVLNNIRQLVLNFFKADDTYNLIFTSGSTESINLSILGLSLKGKEVIISSTEHNSVIRPLMELNNKGEIDVRIAQCDSKGTLAINSIKQLITDKTALIVINYVSNVTGNIQYVKEISKLAKMQNIKLLVDGSQASGNIDINLADLETDFFCFTGHKSLYALQGVGGLIMKKDIDLMPLKYGGTGFRSTLLTQPREFPHKYESGTQNIPGIISLKAGIEFINEVGLDNIIEHKKQLMKLIIDKFEDNDRIKSYFDENNYSWSVLSFNIENVAPEEVSYILKSAYNIEVRSGIHCAPLIHNNLGTYPMGTVRVSPSYFSTKDDINIFVDAITKITQEFK